MTTAAITEAVRLSIRHAWVVFLAFLTVAVLSASYLVHHFAITTDSSKLLSSSLPWRQQDIKLDQAFPQRTNQISAFSSGFNSIFANIIALPLLLGVGVVFKIYYIMA